MPTASGLREPGCEGADDRYPKDVRGESNGQQDRTVLAAIHTTNKGKVLSLDLKRLRGAEPLIGSKERETGICRPSEGAKKHLKGEEGGTKTKKCAAKLENKGGGVDKEGRRGRKATTCGKRIYYCGTRES